MVGCLVLADAIFLAVWQLVDPLKKSVSKRYSLTMRDPFYQENHYVWDRGI